MSATIRDIQNSVIGDTLALPKAIKSIFRLQSGQYCAQAGVANRAHPLRYAALAGQPDSYTAPMPLHSQIS